MHARDAASPDENSFASFAAGDYLTAARAIGSGHWQYWASLALMGRTAGCVDALERADDSDEARFHAAIACWMTGDDERSLAMLRQCTGLHASRLAALIQQPQIVVLAQLPWTRGGCADLLGHVKDSRFHVLNISFHKNDLPNRPYADVHDLVPDQLSPDFFVAAMFEWHLIPPNIRSLGCPVIGQSSDYDLHIQAVAPWLGVFDEMVVLDDVQWRDMRGLASCPVTVYPKFFGVPARIPPVWTGERPVDVYVSGTVVHPYHLDKDAGILDLLKVPDLRLSMMNGFAGQHEYFASLATSKVCCTYVRHPGAMPTRALEALAAGCVVAVQEESALRLYLDQDDGIVPYGARTGSLAGTVRQVLADWEASAARARHGAVRVRTDFRLETVASQYLRFLTVLAARPREAHTGPPAATLVQKRAVIHKGWLPSYEFSGSLLRGWASASVDRLQLEDETARSLNDIARERLLAHYHEPRERTQSWLPGVLEPLDRACAMFSDALVPRFNLVRMLLHFGDRAAMHRALRVVDEIFASSSGWVVDPLDDVLPWDFCPAFFNYRRYLDTVTAMLAGREVRAASLAETILASLHHYRAIYAHPVPSECSPTDHAATAVRLDPGFPEYVLAYSRRLLERGDRADHEIAAVLLQRMAATSARVVETADLAGILDDDLRAGWADDLALMAARFWTATELRESLPEPWPRSPLE